MTDETNQLSALIAQGIADSADALKGFGLSVTAADVTAIYDRWIAIPEDERHLVALCFMQFDNNKEVFKLPSVEPAL